MVHEQELDLAITELKLWLTTQHHLPQKISKLNYYVVLECKLGKAKYPKWIIHCEGCDLRTFQGGPQRKAWRRFI